MDDDDDDNDDYDDDDDEWDWVCVCVCPFSEFCPCVVSGGIPDFVLTTHSERLALVYLSSVLVHSLFLPPQASDPWAARQVT